MAALCASIGRLLAHFSGTPEKLSASDPEPRHEHTRIRRLRRACRHDENQIVAERRAKLAALRGGGQAFPNDFRRDALAADLHAAHGGKGNEELEPAGSAPRSPAG